MCERCPNGEALKADDMTVLGQLFGTRITPREGMSPLVTLYVEDDELWHVMGSFDQLWIPDLLRVVHNTHAVVMK